MPWFTYIVECADGTYYTGITTDLARRLAMHNRGVASRFTRGRLPVELRYVEQHASRSAASIREAELKGWRRGRKDALITSPANLLPGTTQRGR